MKRLTVNIGYERYLIDEKDAIRLLAIAARCQAITHKDGHYNGPFVLKEDGDPFVTGAELIEFEDEASGQGLHLAAARNLP